MESGERVISHLECGGPALIWRGVTAHHHKIVRASDIRHLNGELAKGHEPIVCESCGRPITLITDGQQVIHAITYRYQH